MIDEDRMNAAQRTEKETSTLLPLVSACVNHPGFKYKLQELRQMGICEFMDSVQRLQVYESKMVVLLVFVEVKKLNIRLDKLLYPKIILGLVM